MKGAKNQILGLCVLKKMKWAKRVSQETMHDAWMTFNTHFQHEDCRISEAQFYKMRHVYQSRVELSFLRNRKYTTIQNLDVTRMKANSPESAYPEENRPRGQSDIDSVYYHMNATNVSPIVILRRGNGQNTKYETILLDGVHRLVAASILHRLSSKNRATVPVLYLDQRLNTKSCCQVDLQC